MKDSVLTALRSATADAHRRLEEFVNIPARVADMAQYTRLLQGFLGWYEPMEGGLVTTRGWPAHGYDPALRRKAPWLVADLRSLGMASSEIEHLPRCDHVPVMISLAQAFGCAYVMEGATLGGRAVTGMIAGCVPAEARTFFRAYGEQTRERWIQFTGAIEQYHHENDNTAEIVTAAVESFATLENFLRKQDVA